MKTSRLRTLAIIGLAVMAATPAMAKNNQRMAAENAAYWQGQNRPQGNTTRVNASESTTQARSDVSQYPCHRCTYDSARGGYVRSSSPKN
jgi:hypothetical protein